MSIKNLSFVFSALIMGWLCHELYTFIELKRHVDKNIPPGLIQAAKDGNAEAMERLGIIYINAVDYIGDTKAENGYYWKRGIKYLGLAAENGRVLAQWKLGLAYVRQNDLEKSEMMFREAVAGLKRRHDSYSLYLLHVAYVEGFWSPKRSSKSNHYYDLYVEQCKKEGFRPHNQYTLPPSEN